MFSQLVDFLKDSFNRSSFCGNDFGILKDGQVISRIESFFPSVFLWGGVNFVFSSFL
jgi:hypothetical protein